MLITQLRQIQNEQITDQEEKSKIDENVLDYFTANTELVKKLKNIMK